VLGLLSGHGIPLTGLLVAPVSTATGPYGQIIEELREPPEQLGPASPVLGDLRGDQEVGGIVIIG
jgi:hypothetical protein